MKLAFDLVASKNALWVRFLRAKYKFDMIVSTSIPRRNCSLVWKEISLVWDDVRDNILHGLGNGSSINFWGDNWIYGIDPLLSHVSESIQYLIRLEKVVEMGDV
ncbi:hypothetical protein V6N13_034144 [Hibiscus sabdariffa]